MTTSRRRVARWLDGWAMQLDLQQAARWIPGAFVRAGSAGAAQGLAGAPPLSAVCTDSRALRHGCLFVALRGERFDGHDYIEAAIAAGAAAVMVERDLGPLAVAQLQVPDTTTALGQLARGWRAQFDLPVIAVTGSNGKTTVKAMIAAILEAAFGAGHFHATPGNFNNQIGVPLTLLGLRREHRAAVIELGMNHVGEIAGLAQMAQAHVALVNNAQREHQEFLDGVAATAHENGAAIEALAQDGVAVFPADDACASIWRTLAGPRPIVDFALAEASPVPAGGPLASLTASPHADAAQFSVCFAAASAWPAGVVRTQDAQAWPAELALSLAIDGQHNVRNALAAAACCLAIGVAPASIAAGLAAFRPVAGRLVRHTRADSVVVLDDSYNANPDSVRAAIDLLAQLRARSPDQRVVLVLGDMGEVGAQGPEVHAEVGAWAEARGLDALLATGTLAAQAIAGWQAQGQRGGAQFFATIEELIVAVRGLATRGTTVLVKGSRFMRMERVVRALLDAETAPAWQGAA